MNKKTCVITGANGGIGKATAIELARSGFEIVMFARESEKTIQAIEEIKSKSSCQNIRYIPVDLAEIPSIKRACKIVSDDYPSIDFLINNAGVVKRRYETNSEGVELTFAVNYLAPFLISRLLNKNLSNSKSGRITNVTSALYKKGKLPTTVPPVQKKFDGEKAYADSKMMILLDSLFLSTQYSGLNISVNCIHPGVVSTDAFREYPKWLNWILSKVITKPDKAGLTMAYVITSPDLQGVSGKYFNVEKQEVVKNQDQLLVTYESIEPSVRELLNI